MTRPDYTAEILNYQSFPVMASIDIQSTLIRATIKAQKPFIVHYHPRGSETLTVLEGTIRIGMKFEGLMGREIENEVKKGQATVIPQGILHSFFCSSTVDCVFMSVLNSADPGTIVV